MSFKINTHFLTIKDRIKNKMSVYHIILLSLVFLHLVLALPLLASGFPNGGDFFFHYFYMTKTKEIIETAENFETLHLWNNFYNLGTPLFYYYQPLPSFVGAFFLRFLDHLLYFKLSLILLFAALPLCFYHAARKLSCTQRTSLLFTAFFTFLSSADVYQRIGTFTYLSSFQYGGYAFLFASIFFPLAIAYGYTYLTKELDILSHSFFLSLLFSVLTFFSHILIGTILFSLLFFWGFMLFARAVFKRAEERKKLLYRLCVFTFFFAAATAIIWFPALQTKEYYGGLEEAGADYTYGFSTQLFLDILNGTFFDGYRIPFFTVFFFIGFLSLCCSFFIPSLRKTIIEFIHDSQELSFGYVLCCFILGSFLISIFIASGAAVKILLFLGFPLSLLLFPAGKFITAVHFFSGFITVIGITMLMSLCMRAYTVIQEKYGQEEKRKTMISFATLFFVILLFSLFLYSSKEIFSRRIDTGFDYTSTVHFDTDPYLQSLSAFLKEQPYAALYLGEKTSTSRVQQMPEVISYYTQKPVLFTGSGGFHETLSSQYTAFYMEKMPLLFHMNALFNAPYILFIEGNNTRIWQNSNETRGMNESEQQKYYAKHYPLPALSFSLTEQDIENKTKTTTLPVFFNPEFILYSTNLKNISQNSFGFFSSVHAAVYLNTTPKKAGNAVKIWMASLFPYYNEFFVLTIPEDGTIQEKDFPTSTQPLDVIFTDAVYPFIAKENLETIPKENDLCGSLVLLEKEEVANGQYRIWFTKRDIPTNDTALREYTKFCFLLLKVSAHPDWKAKIISRSGMTIKSGIYHLSPSFMGVPIGELPAGEYYADFSFSFSETRKKLLFVSLLTFLLAFFATHSFGKKIIEKGKIENWNESWKENLEEKQKVKTLPLFVFFTLLFLLSIAKTESLFEKEIPIGGDFIGHYTVLQKTQTALYDLIKGETPSLWFSDANAGYPLFYYYQPLAYIFFAGISLLLSPFFSLVTVYKLSIVFGYALIPISIFICCLLLDWPRKYAFYTAVLSFFLSSTKSYAVIGTIGFDSIFTYGLWTHLFAVPLFILSVGIYYKLLKEKINRENLWKHCCCIMLIAVTTYIHVLVGLLSLIPATLLFFIQITRKDNEKKEKLELFLLYFFHMFLFFVLTAPLFFEMLTNAEYYGGLTMSYATYTSGFGLSFFRDYIAGYFLDVGRALPVLTILSVVGIIFFLFKTRKKAENDENKAVERESSAFFLLLLFFVSLFFATGALTSILKKIAYLDSIWLLHHLSLFPTGKAILVTQLAALFCIGYAAGTLDTKLRDLFTRKNVPIIFFYGFLSFSALLLSQEYGQNISVSIQKEHHAILQALEKQKEHGRVYIFEDMIKSSSLMAELVTVYTDKPVFNTVNGFHETISVPYLWQYARDLRPTYWLDDLFGATYELSYYRASERNYTTILSSKDGYTLAAINTTGYFSIVQADTALFMKNKDAIDFLKKWLESSMPLANHYLVFIPDHGTVQNLSMIDKTRHNFSNYILQNPEKEDDILFYGNSERAYELAPLFVWDNTTLRSFSTVPQDLSPQHVCPAITILKQRINNEEGIYEVVFHKEKQETLDKDCYLLLKVSMHPHWKAALTTENGTQKQLQTQTQLDIVQLSPAFMGINLDALSAGTYTITFTFHSTAFLRIELFLLFIFFLSMCLIFSHFLTKKKKQQ